MTAFLHCSRNAKTVGNTFPTTLRLKFFFRVRELIRRIRIQELTGCICDTGNVATLLAGMGNSRVWFARSAEHEEIQQARAKGQAVTALCPDDRPEPSRFYLWRTPYQATPSTWQYAIRCRSCLRIAGVWLPERYNREHQRTH